MGLRGGAGAQGPRTTAGTSGQDRDRPPGGRTQASLAVLLPHFLLVPLLSWVFPATPTWIPSPPALSISPHVPRASPRASTMRQCSPTAPSGRRPA